MRKLTLLIALLALTVNSWAQAPTVFTWDASDLATVNLTMGHTESQEIDHITVTLGYQDAVNDYCHFFYQGSPYNYCGFSMRDGGSLTFAPESGTLTSIVITCDAFNPPLVENSGWEWDSENPTLLRWTGSASSVVLKSNSSISLTSGAISSIEFTVSDFVPTTAVTWEGDDLTSVAVEMENGTPVSSSQTVNGITITANAPAKETEDDYNSSYFGTYFDEYDSNNNNTSLTVFDKGSLTFAPESGQLTKIVITLAQDGSSNVENLDESAGWKWDENTLKLTWTGDAASSVVLAPKNPETGFMFSYISSIVFKVTSGESPVGPTPSGESIIWEERQVSHVLLYADEVGNTQKAPLIKNIFVSLTRKSEGYGTSCQFTEKYLAIENCGELKFQSVAGDIQGIVINGSNTYADNLSADWTYDNVANTLTWAGTASDEVTLSGNIYFNISSIEFTYTPASAPRLGEIINGCYEITGAHTAKVITAAGNIPDYIEDDAVTYYITEIGDYAYYNDQTEGYFYFGANIAKVGAHAFEGCSRAIEFTFHSTVLDEIGDEAFKNCKLLGWLNFDTQMPPVLGSNAFSGDGFLNHINVYPYGSVLDDYKAAAGWITYADKITPSYPFPATIGEQFFFDNQTTTNIYAVSSVDPKEIKVMPYTAEVNALYPITRTGTLIIPEEASYLNTKFSVTGIGANAYKDSARFDVVMIPQAVKSIEAGAFLNCTGVENVFFLWNDPTTVTWADASVGAEFKTATGGTKIFVPEGKLAAYQAWAPAWKDCMYEGGILEVDATAGQDPDKTTRYYRTFFDSEHDYMMPPSVWAYVGYVRNNEFILRPIAFDGEIVPAGTAVVLESETPIYSLIEMTPAVQPYTGTNDLRGSDVAFPRADLGADADKVYVLGKSASIGTDHLVGMGLYRYVGETLGAHKAYMVLDNVPTVPESGQQNAPARFLFKYENEATGVENVQSDKVQCTKVIRDGQLIIIKDGKEYNAQGLIIK